MMRELLEGGWVTEPKLAKIGKITKFYKNFIKTNRSYKENCTSKLAHAKII